MSAHRRAPARADLAFVRHHFWQRLAANVAIVLLFGAFYPRFAKAS